MTVVEETYAVARLLPADERFGLSAQMRKAAISIPSYVAEGFARGRARMCAHFVRIAIGSNAELDTQLEAARRLKFVDADAARPLPNALESRASNPARLAPRS